jgi:type IV secretory pathway VirB2 component (pilin)
MKTPQKRHVVFGLAGISALIAVGLCLPDQVHAASTGLAWEGPLTMLTNSLSGPVARNIGILALVAAGVMSIFGGEMSDMTRRFAMIVIVAALLVLAPTILNTFFPSASGALLF